MLCYPLRSINGKTLVLSRSQSLMLKFISTVSDLGICAEDWDLFYVVTVRVYLFRGLAMICHVEKHQKMLGYALFSLSKERGVWRIGFIENGRVWDGLVEWASGMLHSYGTEITFNRIV